MRVHDVQVALVPLRQMYSAKQLLSGLFSQQLRKCMCDIDGKQRPIVLKIQRACALGKAFWSRDVFLGHETKRKGRSVRRKQHIGIALIG